MNVMLKGELLHEPECFKYSILAVDLGKDVEVRSRLNEVGKV